MAILRVQPVVFRMEYSRMYPYNAGTLSTLLEVLKTMAKKVFNIPLKRFLYGFTLIE